MSNYRINKDKFEQRINNKWIVIDTKRYRAGRLAEIVRADVEESDQQFYEDWRTRLPRSVTAASNNLNELAEI